MGVGGGSWHAGRGEGLSRHGRQQEAAGTSRPYLPLSLLRSPLAGPPCPGRLSPLFPACCPRLCSQPPTALPTWSLEWRPSCPWQAACCICILEHACSSGLAAMHPLCLAAMQATLCWLVWPCLDLCEYLGGVGCAACFAAPLYPHHTTPPHPTTAPAAGQAAGGDARGGVPSPGGESDQACVASSVADRQPKQASKQASNTELERLTPSQSPLPAPTGAPFLSLLSFRAQAEDSFFDGENLAGGGDGGGGYGGS